MSKVLGWLQKKKKKIPQYVSLTAGEVGLLTAFVTVKDSWHSNKVNGHAEEGVGFDIERLCPSHARSERR